MILCEICYHLYKLINVKNTHGGLLLLDELQTIFSGRIERDQRHEVGEIKLNNAAHPGLFQSPFCLVLRSIYINYAFRFS